MSHFLTTAATAKKSGPSWDPVYLVESPEIGLHISSDVMLPTWSYGPQTIRKFLSPLDQDLLAFWDFDESSGNRIDHLGHSILTDNNTVTSTTGKIDNAAVFTAANSEYLSRADGDLISDLQFGDEDFTIAGWVYLTSKPSNDMTMVAQWQAAGHRSFVLQWEDTSDVFQWKLSDDGTNSTTCTATTFGTLSTATWYFVLIEYDSTCDKMAIEVNDSSRDEAFHEDGTTAVTSALEFGRANATDYLNGRLDAWGIWGRLLNEREKSGLYNLGNGREQGTQTIPSLDCNLISHWRLEEASGDERADAVHTNHLTDNNSVTTNTGKLGTNAGQFTRANSEYLNKSSPDDILNTDTDNPDLTLSAWVYLDSTPAGDAGIISIFTASGNQRSFALYYDQSSGAFAFLMSSDGTSGNTTQCTATTFGAASTGTWYFVLAEYDNANSLMALEVNNLTRDTASHSSGFYKSSTADLLIGSYDGGNYWDGRIDSVSVWRRLLAPTEREALYNRTTGVDLTRRAWENRLLSISDVSTSIEAVPGGIASVSSITVDVAEDGTGQSVKALIDSNTTLLGKYMTVSMLLSHTHSYADRIWIWSGVIDDTPYQDSVARILGTDLSLAANRVLPLDIIDQESSPSAPRDSVNSRVPLVYGEFEPSIEANGTLNDSSLTAFWNFEETSGDRADSVGSNTLTDNNTVTAKDAVLGNGASFTRANSEYLSIADNTDMSTGDIDFTFSVWCYLLTKPGDMGVFGKWETSGNAREYHLRFDDSSNRFIWAVSSNGTTETEVTSVELGPPMIGVFYHIVCWHDSLNNEIGISVNGGEPDFTATTAGVNDSASAFTVGRYNSTNYWEGVIDCLGFWKKVLTKKERLRLYNKGVGIQNRGRGDSIVPMVLIDEITNRYAVASHKMLDTGNHFGVWYQRDESFAKLPFNQIHEAVIGFDLTRHTTTSGHVASWDMDEDSGTRDDAQSASLDLTESGGTVNATTGIRGQAALFVPADTAFLTAGDSTSFESGTGTGDIVFCCWVYLNSVPTGGAYYGIMGKWTETGNQREYALVYHSTSSRFEFWFSNTGSDKFVATADSFGEATRFGGDIKDPSQWYFIFCEFDKDLDTAFIQINNGPLDETFENNINQLASGTAAFTVGAVDGGNYLDGAVDEVQFWKTRRSRMEKDWLYRAGLGQTYPFTWPHARSINDGREILQDLPINFKRFGYVPLAAKINRTEDVDSPIEDAIDYDDQGGSGTTQVNVGADDGPKEDRGIYETTHKLLSPVPLNTALIRLTELYHDSIVGGATPTASAAYRLSVDVLGTGSQIRNIFDTGPVPATQIHQESNNDVYWQDGQAFYYEDNLKLDLNEPFTGLRILQENIQWDNSNNKPEQNPVAGSGHNLVIGDIYAMVAFEGAGSLEPVFLLSAQGRNDDSTGSITGTASAIIEHPIDILHSILVDELGYVIDRGNFANIRSGFSTVKFSGGVGSGWFKEQLTARELMNDISRQGSFYIYPWCESIWRISKFDSSAASIFSFDDNNILLSSNEGSDTTFAVSPGTLDSISTHFEVQYGWHAGFHDFSKLRYAKPTGTNHASTNLASTLQTTQNTHGALQPFLIDAYLVWEDTTADTLLKNYVDYYSSQKIECEFETTLVAIHLHVGDVVDVTFLKLPNADSGQNFQILSKSINFSDLGNPRIRLRCRRLS